MADLKYEPVPHNHAAFLVAARQRPGFNDAYDSLELKYTVASQMLKAHENDGLTQEVAAARIGTPKSSISR